MADRDPSRDAPLRPSQGVGAISRSLPHADDRGPVSIGGQEPRLSREACARQVAAGRHGR